jgi:hypothetical protein
MPIWREDGVSDAVVRSERSVAVPTVDTGQVGGGAGWVRAAVARAQEHHHLEMLSVACRANDTSRRGSVDYSLRGDRRCQL